MIHSTELMIGDIIQSQGEYYKVTDIHEDCYCCSEIPPQKLRTFMFENCDEYAEGVPLTSEILEKNGFEHGDGMVSDAWWYGDFRLSASCFGVFKKIRHVHQLQHALRLCGLNKLADNFKL